MRAERVGEHDSHFDINYLAIATGWGSGVWEFMENTGKVVSGKLLKM